MFPWVYEFHWTPAHIIFLGVFLSVATMIAATVARSAWRTYRDFKRQETEAIQWHANFEDLPRSARICRHELTGEVKHRTCENRFDCRTCAAHTDFLAHFRPQLPPEPAVQSPFGFAMPLDRLYHRGHTWAKPEDDGTYLIGLDDFAARVIGSPDEVQLPEIGERVEANGTAWHINKRGARLRILSPLDGTVVERGRLDTGWVLKVKADGSEANTRHLLRGAEIRPWIMRELERLQRTLGTEGAGFSLADGGEVLPDMWKHYPDVDWDGVWGETLLQA